MEDFISEIAKYVQKYAPQYGILVCSPVIAQAILESGHGKSELAVNANNFFGLKYRENRCPTANGIYYKVGSEQNPDGSYTSSAMKWMKFPDMESCVIGYFDFTNTANYQNLKGVKEPRKYLENIKADGYATSIQYVDNLMAVIKSYDLTKYDPEDNGGVKMAYTNSPLATYTSLSPNKNSPRNHAIDRITPHCFVGQVTVKRGCEVFLPTSRKASCNYVVGYDGQIGLCVEEKDRSWCSSSSANDNRAITMEISSDTTAPYAITDAAYKATVNLMEDICRRNGKNKLIWMADKAKTLAYEPKDGEMVITVHRWFAAKACPGDYIYNRLGQMADEVNARLSGGNAQNEQPVVDNGNKEKTMYRVQLGAYKVKANADKQLAIVKDKGFDAIVTLADGIYRVQTGAFSVKENADRQLQKMKEAGFADAFIKVSTIGGETENAEPEVEEKETTQEEFVKQIQAVFGMPTDGKPTDALLAKTVTVSKTKNKNHAVVTPLERYLKLLGYYLGKVEADSGNKPVFGSGMDDAVRKFQKDNGCVSDGEITARNKTWHKLLGMD